MPFDFAPSSRELRGRRNYLDGLSAEDSVARHYALAGADLLAERWRGQSGEIDLIFRQGDSIVFVEVKKSATHDAAADHLTQRQMNRIFAAAEEFVADLPTGLATIMRFDAALVDCAGRVQIIGNIPAF